MLQIMNEKYQMKTQLQQTENEKQLIKTQLQQKEIINLQNLSLKAIQVHLSGYEGIISFLRTGNSNSVIISSSSEKDSSCKSDNVLNPDDKYWWSQNEKDSWILFSFNGYLISPSGYFIRNKTYGGAFAFSPQSWKLEGSLNNSNWITLHEVKKCSLFKKNDQEASFKCEPEQFFPYLRLIQTQENLKKNYASDFSYSFLLSFVELAGRIICIN